MVPQRTYTFCIVVHLCDADGFTATQQSSCDECRVCVSLVVMSFLNRRALCSPNAGLLVKHRTTVTTTRTALVLLERQRRQQRQRWPIKFPDTNPRQQCVSAHHHHPLSTLPRCVQSGKTPTGYFESHTSHTQLICCGSRLFNCCLIFLNAFWGQIAR